MEDMLSETDRLVHEAPPFYGAIAYKAQALGDLLLEHKGADVLVLDLREMSAWTDFFVIATVLSETHMDGLERHVKDFCRDREIEILRQSRRPSGQQDEWRIIDLGSTVIHLMSRKARDFYELERLYSMATMTTPTLVASPPL
jgi:ribosome-associated protein